MHGQLAPFPLGLVVIFLRATHKDDSPEDLFDGSRESQTRVLRFCCRKTYKLRATETECCCHKDRTNTFEAIRK